MPTLYKITEELIALEETIVEEFEEHGTISPDTRKVIDEWIGDIRTASQEKLQGYAKIIMNLQAKQKAIDEEKKRLSKRSVAVLNSIKALKENVKFFMDTAELKKVEAGAFSFTVCKNGGKLPLLLNCLPESLPEAYQVKTISSDNDKLRTDLIDGKLIEGVELGARGTNVRVS